MVFQKTNLNIKAYIESGILELFAMDLLSEAERAEVAHFLSIYAELGEELERIEAAMANYAETNSILPPPHVEEKLVDAISNLQKENEMALDDLPLINKYSDYKNWLKLVSKFGELPIAANGQHLTVLRNDKKVTQILVVSTANIDEEIHESEQESFLILSGECKCTIGDQVKLMSAGDFMNIPLFEPHHVELVSPKVTAILQRIRI